MGAISNHLRAHSLNSFNSWLIFSFLPAVCIVCPPVHSSTGDFMKRNALAIVFFIAVSATSMPAQTAKPEEVGISTERLKRIHDLIERRIETRDISGAV